MILLLVTQAAFLIHLLVRGGRISQTLNAVLTILSLLTALHIVSERNKAAYKITWVFLILLFPLFGGLLYLMFHFQGPTRSLANKIRTVEAENAAQFALPYVMTGSPPWAPPIWIFAVCIFTLSAERSCSAVLLSRTSSRIFSLPCRPAAPLWRGT